MNEQQNIADRASWFVSEDADVLLVRGSERIELLHRLSTNDLTPLNDKEKKVSTVFTTAQGKIVDWVSAFSLEDELLLRLSPNRGKDLANWINQFIIMEDVEIDNVSSQWCCLVVQGKADMSAIGIPDQLDREHFVHLEDGLCFRAHAAYGDRYDILIKREQEEGWRDKLSRAGYPHVSDSFLEESRILAGVPSPHFEFEDEINPLELRLKEHVISWTKGCYIGQEVISRLDSYDKLARILMGFECAKPIPEDESIRLRKNGKNLGRITSKCLLSNGHTIGLAIVKRDEATPGAVELSGDFGQMDIELKDRPFWADA